MVLFNKHKAGVSILLVLLALCSFRNYKVYDPGKKYTVDQLRADFSFFRETLEKTHPRLYEYTSKEEFHHLFDSLYKAIDHKMTEREFQYFLSPVISKTHCSHTKILPSKEFSDNIDKHIIAPPFKLYFDSSRAFLLNRYFSDTSIQIGAEILSINGIPTEQLINNFAARIHNEGNNTTFIYNRLNAAVNGLFPGLCDHPPISKYSLTYLNPGSKVAQAVKLRSIKLNEYLRYNPASPVQNYSYRTIDSLNTAVLKYYSFKFRADSSYKEFLDKAFAEIRSKNIDHLVIDVRGNIGGLPEPAAELLRKVSGKEFSYYNKKVSWEFDNIIKPSESQFTGELYFLVDGGCRSTTGHFISLVKYHKLGTIIGEETCASFSCNSNGRPYPLPNTGLILECPYTTFDVAVEGQPRGNGVQPNIYIKPSVGDVIRNEDAVLQFTLDKIRQVKK